MKAWRSRYAVTLVAWVFAGPLMAQQPVMLSVPGRSGANPTLDARGAFVAVSWSAASSSAMDVYLAVSRDAGRTFSAPVTVNRVAGQARVSGEQPPRVALVPKAKGEPDIVVVWTVKTGTDWQLLYARSTDGGRTFGAAQPVPGSDAPGSRGWEAVDVDATGRVNVLWLDHRDAAAMPMTGHSATTMDPTERATLSRLYFSSLATGTDAGGKSTTRAARSVGNSITQSVCYCCKTALTHRGSVLYAAWRQVYPGSIRDIAFSTSRDGGRTFSAPVKVSDDQWQIDGCPDNGPAMVVDTRQDVHVLWPTVKSGRNATKDAMELSLFYARRGASGRFTSRREVPSSGQPSHPVMVLGADDVPFTVWDEVVDGQRRLSAARVVGDRFVPVTIPGAGGRFYPSAATVTGGTVVAWVQQQTGKETAIGVVRVEAEAAKR